MGAASPMHWPQQPCWSAGGADAALSSIARIAISIGARLLGLQRRRTHLGGHVRPEGALLDVGCGIADVSAIIDFAPEVPSFHVAYLCCALPGVPGSVVSPPCASGGGRASF
jgi:hypothetical protein